MTKKRLIVTSVISIILISLLFIGSTYSIFTTGDVDENQNVYTTGNLNVTYTLSSDNVKLEDITPTSVEDAVYIKPYRLTVTNNGNVSYKFNVILTDTTASNAMDTSYIMTQVGKLEPIALGSTTSNIIKSDIVVPANGSLDIDVRVFISDSVPNSEIGKNFYAKLSIDGLAVYDSHSDVNNQLLIADYKKKIPYGNASGVVMSLYNDGSTINTVNIGGDTSNPQVSLNATQGIMLDNNGDYRYYGADPNNYVSYNNELWRIISVGNVKSSTTDTTGETRVKIVKADILTAKETGTSTDIIAFSYDSSASTVNSGYGVNDWSKADLMTELNTLYYNSTSGTCYTGKSNASKLCDFTNTGLSAEARNLTADALYYLGGSSTYQGLYADDYYTFERGTKVYGCGTDDGACPRATTWTGRIGIIYPSDYSYATDLSVCTSDAYHYDNDGCYDNDWLLYASNYQWTIAPRSSIESIAFRVHRTGFVGSSLDVYNAAAVRPVQYLRSNVAIVGGEGTSGDPYQLELS